MLDLNRGRVLREVARLGSMTAAARALSYTQPAVSHHIARLEAEAGTPLVVRHGRGVRLTEAGRILVEHVEDVLARTEAAQERIAAIAGLRAGRVRVTAFPTAAAAFLPDALAALRDRAPDVVASLTEAEPPAALAALRAGDTDLALVFAYPHTPPDTGAGFREIPLRRDPIRLAVPAAHPLAGAARLEPAELSEETWAAGCERCRGHLLRACARAGFSPRIAYATDDHIAVQRLVARGLAITAMPALAFALHHEPGVALPPCPALGRRRITALVPAGPLPPAVAALLDEIITVARDADQDETAELETAASGARGR
ncbi:LysR family transcriptional regulator [Actinomadura vinacea]|uniref:LysR family transcriptional regulator n=1 Tax=Actinomadura vinacea TaxID=115336 RepID=A0ABN3JX91_9ACTN